MSAPFEKAKMAGYTVAHEHGEYWRADNPAGDIVAPPGADFWPSERAAWEACDRHRMFGDVQTPPPVLRTVVVALDHLTLATVERMRGPHENWPICGGRFGDDRFMVYAQPDDDGEIPADLFAVTSWAAAEGFDRIEFDPEREHTPGLKVYDHAPRKPVDALEGFAMVRALLAANPVDRALGPEFPVVSVLRQIAEAVGAPLNNKPAAPVKPDAAANCARYMDALDDLEIPPNGDDCNALYALALGGDYQPPHKGGR